MITFDSIKVQRFSAKPVQSASQWLRSHTGSTQVSDSRYLGGEADSVAVNDIRHLSKIDFLDAVLNDSDFHHKEQEDE